MLVLDYSHITSLELLSSSPWGSLFPKDKQWSVCENTETEQKYDFSSLDRQSLYIFCFLSECNDLKSLFSEGRWQFYFLCSKIVL